MIDGNNLSRAKSLNQSAIRKIIYHSGPIARQQIADRLSLTLPTITTNVARLISQGLLKEVEDTRSKKSTVGRKTLLVDIEESARYFMGIEMRSPLRRIVITSYRGEILYKISDDTLYTDYEECLEATCELVEKLLASCGFAIDTLSGIGICLPGLVDPTDGILVNYTRYNWVQKPVREDFSRRLQYDGPICIENNSIARAYTLYMFDQNLLGDDTTYAYLNVATGISCPLLTTGIQTERPVLAIGEIGHMVMVPGGRPCHCGIYGCLEAYSSEDAILARCQELLDRQEAPYLSQICQGQHLTISHVLSAQLQRESSVCAVIDEAIYYLGIAIANVENFVRTKYFIINCRLFSDKTNRQKLTDTIQQNLYTRTLPKSEIVFKEPDEYSGALGGAALAINYDLEQYVE